jgi:hypothetical protein
MIQPDGAGGFACRSNGHTDGGHHCDIKSLAHRGVRVSAARLKSIPEGEGNLLDNTLLVYVHEHAEANSRKTSGMSAILAGHAGNLKTGMHSSVTGTVGDLYLTLADEVMGAHAGKFPTASKKLSDLV